MKRHKSHVSADDRVVSAPRVISPFEVPGVSNVVAEFLGPKQSSPLYETSASTRHTLRTFESERFRCARLLQRDISPCLQSQPLANQEGRCNRWCKDVLVEELVRLFQWAHTDQLQKPLTVRMKLTAYPNMWAETDLTEQDTDTQVLLTHISLYELYAMPRIDWTLTSEYEDKEQEGNENSREEEEEDDEDEYERKMTRVGSYTWTRKSKKRPAKDVTQRSRNVSEDTLRSMISQVFANQSKTGWMLVVRGEITGGARPVGHLSDPYQYFAPMFEADLVLVNRQGMPLLLDALAGTWKLSGVSGLTHTGLHKEVSLPAWINLVG